MSMTDDAMLQLCEAMRECGAGLEFELSLGELVGRYRRAHDARMLDAEAARLLPLGNAVVREIQGCCKATVYNRAARDRKSKVMQAG